MPQSKSSTLRPGGGEPRAEGAFKHVAGAARVLADDHHGLVLLAVIPAQIPADAESVIDGQALVGLSAETVGPEIFTHVFPPYDIPAFAG